MARILDDFVLDVCGCKGRHGCVDMHYHTGQNLERKKRPVIRQYMYKNTVGGFHRGESILLPEIDSS